MTDARPPAPGRPDAMERPVRVWAAAAVVALVAAWLLQAAYVHLNQEDPDAAGARIRLGLSLAVSLLGLAGSAWLLRRGAGWLALSGAGGLVFLYDNLEEAWDRWGVNWEDGMFLVPIVVPTFALLGIATLGLRRNLGARRASQASLHAAAFFLVPTLLFAASILSRLDAVAADADRQWTGEHADPAVGALLLAAALLGAAVAWRRRTAR